MNQNFKVCSGKNRNIMEKGENADYLQFLLLSNIFKSLNPLPDLQILGSSN